MSEGERPAGAVEGDGERPPAAPIDAGHAVALAVMVDDVARLQFVGVDRGHRPPVRLDHFLADQIPLPER